MSQFAENPFNLVTVYSGLITTYYITNASKGVLLSLQLLGPTQINETNVTCFHVHICYRNVKYVQISGKSATLLIIQLLKIGLCHKKCISIKDLYVQHTVKIS